MVNEGSLADSRFPAKTVAKVAAREGGNKSVTIRII